MRDGADCLEASCGMICTAFSFSCQHIPAGHLVSRLSDKYAAPVPRAFTEEPPSRTAPDNGPSDSVTRLFQQLKRRSNRVSSAEMISVSYEVLLV